MPQFAYRCARLFVLLTLVSTAARAADPPAKSTSPLKDYVTKADDSYRWVKRREGRVGGADFVELTLTSQTWRGIVWKHQLFIVKPSDVKNAEQGLLLIGGGRWRKELEVAPKEDETLPREALLLAASAARIKSPVAVLTHVPHQPILDGKVEDQIIAYTFDKYFETGDAEWPLLLPMVKSAVRAMDAVQECCKKEWDVTVKRFTVTGASKRGWTTWLTAAVDPRVSALVPMVIDVLNMQEQMKHQLATWGKYSEEIGDYTERKIQNRTDTPQGRALNAIVDPYSYRRALTQPKLILLGTNDRYWPLDALNVYWDGLEGDKYVTYVPNNGHGLKDVVRIMGSITAIHRAAAGDLRLPKLIWKLEEANGHLHLRVTSDQKPKSVAAWTASSTTRDFRPAEWKSQPTKANGDEYEFRLPVPDSGYAALFGEAVFEDGDLPFYLSTNVKIVTKEKPKK
jgi:PhoPQ-activated pathogenicity-related protein